MQILSRFKSIDVFGRRVELRLDRKKTHKTYCGAGATLVISLFIATVVYIFTNQYIQYDNPYLRIYDELLSDPLAYNINLQIGLYSNDSSLTSLDSTLTLVANNVFVDGTTGLSTYNPLQLVPCDSSSLTCISANSDIQMLPYDLNEFLDTNVSYVEVMVFDCQSYARYSPSANGSNNCRSESEIQASLLAGMGSVLQIEQFTVNPMEFDSPITKSVKSLSRQLTLPETIDLSFHQIQVSTDRGVILEDRDYNSATSFSKKSISPGVGSTSSRFQADAAPLQIIRVLITNQKYCVDRSYSKVQVYLANVGGIIKMLMVFGEFLIGPFVRFSLNTKIVNDIFEFEGGEDANEEQESIDGSSDIDPNENKAEAIAAAAAGNTQILLNNNNNNSNIEMQNTINNASIAAILERISPSNAVTTTAGFRTSKYLTNMMENNNNNSSQGGKGIYNFIKSCAEIKQDKNTKDEEAISPELPHHRVKSHFDLSTKRMSNFRKLSSDHQSQINTNQFEPTTVFNMNEITISQQLPVIADRLDDSISVQESQINCLVESQCEKISQLPESKLGKGQQLPFNFFAQSLSGQIPIDEEKNLVLNRPFPVRLSGREFQVAQKSKIELIKLDDRLSSEIISSQQNEDSGGSNSSSSGENKPVKKQSDDLSMDKCPKISLAHHTQEEEQTKPPLLMESSRSRFISSNLHSHWKRNIERQNSAAFISTPKNNPTGQRQHGSDGKSPIRRSGSKRFSVLDKQKIFAMTKLMDNYQNHTETPAHTLKNYGELVGSPKRKNDSEDSVFNRLVRQGKKMKFKFFDFILYHLQCFNKMYSEKKKQIKFSKQKVNERLDVVYIIQKLVEVDKLKMLLLNEDQLKLFEYLPKPIVHLNPKRSSPSDPQDKNAAPHHEAPSMLEAWSMLHQQKKSIAKAIEASKVYQQMMERGQEALSEMDIKLISMLDFRMKEIFNLKSKLQRQKEQLHDSPSLFPTLKLQTLTRNTSKIFLNDESANETQVKLIDTVAMQDIQSNQSVQTLTPNIITLQKFPSLNKRMSETNIS